MAPSRGSPSPGGQPLQQHVPVRPKQPGSIASWYCLLQGSLRLWLAGFMEACMLHRPLLFFLRSKPVLVKSSQCFLLNGLFFLGSIMLMDWILAPSLSWLLLLDYELDMKKAYLKTFNAFLIGMWNTIWLYPFYAVSFVINLSWHAEIAKQASQFLQKEPLWPSGLVVGKPEPPPAGTSTSKPTKSSLDSMFQLIGEEVYRVILFTLFFAEVGLLAFIPYIGQPLYFLLLTWLYAYYCFDYKWSMESWSLDKRLQYFESHWAFFSGFGTPFTIMTFFLPFFTSAAVWALAFPLFVLVATASKPEEVVATALHHSEAAPKDLHAQRLPIFWFPTTQTLALLQWMLPPSNEQVRQEAM